MGGEGWGYEGGGGGFPLETRSSISRERVRERETERERGREGGRGGGGREKREMPVNMLAALPDAPRSKLFDAMRREDKLACMQGYFLLLFIFYFFDVIRRG